MRGVEKLASVRRLYRTVGDRCPFFFIKASSFLQRISFPVCKAQLIGAWYENRWGARNTIIFLILRQYYVRTDAPWANSNGGPNLKKKSAKHYWLTMLGKHCLLAERDICASIYWRTDAPRATTIGAPMPPAPIVLAHWKRNNLHVNNAGVTSFTLPIGGPNQKKFKKRRTEQFGAHRLFS